MSPEEPAGFAIEASALVSGNTDRGPFRNKSRVTTGAKSFKLLTFLDYPLSVIIASS